MNGVRTSGSGKSYDGEGGDDGEGYDEDEKVFGGEEEWIGSA